MLLKMTAPIIRVEINIQTARIDFNKHVPFFYTVVTAVVI